ncbi:nucleotide sugar dehydrogenase [Pelagibius sp.]|uniref:nucleotide sugar dehydrogenase n=1 Tax=Pelagibius sp. TaxID=1931238 RepID=UPI003BB13810
MNAPLLSRTSQGFDAILASRAKPSISVFGLGYVGAVSMACLANLGHYMIGIDCDPVKVEAINEGRCTIVEEGLDALLLAGALKGLVNATYDAAWAVANTDITFISVGTPTAEDGGCDVSAIRGVARDIGNALRDKEDYHLVVLRCSVPPDTTMGEVVRTIEKTSGKRLNEDFGVCFNPEFLREGVAVADFHSPPKTVIGASDARAGKMLADLYADVDAEPLLVDIATAEMVKYVDNTWHAAKVTFANEVGRLCKSLLIDSHEIMDIFVRDTKLNLSPYYLKPGFAFGGSCLPKEVRAMEHLASVNEINLPLISSLTRSNDDHIRKALELVRSLGTKRVALLGLSFKAGTDDLRESPQLELLSAILKSGCEVRCFDPNLTQMGNSPEQFAYMHHARPHLRHLFVELPRLLCASLEDATDGADTIIVAHNTPAFRQAATDRDEEVNLVDLVRLFATPPQEASYHGLCW